MKWHCINERTVSKAHETHTIALISLSLIVGLSACRGSTGDSPPYDYATPQTPTEGTTPTATLTPSEETTPIATPTPTDGTTPIATPTPSAGNTPTVTPIILETPTPVNTPSTDTDQDGISDSIDNCPATPNTDQYDADWDGIGDACDDCQDMDRDAVCDDDDNCPYFGNPDQADSDNDGMGNACDRCATGPEVDGDDDGICDSSDNCPDAANSNQMDRDGDGTGDVCDPCPDAKSTTDCAEPGSTNPSGSLYLVGTDPSNGYKAVATNATGFLYFSEPYTGDPSRIHVMLASSTQGEAPMYPHVTMSSDLTSASMSLALRSFRDYCLVVDIEEQPDVDGRWPIHSTSCFTTFVPCGISTDIGHTVLIEVLGATVPLALELLNEALQTLGTQGDNLPVVLLMESIRDSAKPPLVVTSDLGSYIVDDRGKYHLSPTGYTTTFHDCTIDATGSFHCSAEQALLPIQLSDTSLTIDVRDAEIDAIAGQPVNELSDFVLQGYIMQADIYQLFKALGDEYAEYASYIELDLDTDDDGTLDAASFVLSSKPEPIYLEGTECPVY